MTPTTAPDPSTTEPTTTEPTTTDRAPEPTTASGQRGPRWPRWLRVAITPIAFLAVLVTVPNLTAVYLPFIGSGPPQARSCSLR